MVIGTDCMSSCKSNYHSITTTTAPSHCLTFLRITLHYKNVYIVNTYSIMILSFSLILNPIYQHLRKSASAQILILNYSSSYSHYAWRSTASVKLPQYVFFLFLYYVLPISMSYLPCRCSYTCTSIKNKHRLTYNSIFLFILLTKHQCINYCHCV